MIGVGRAVLIVTCLVVAACTAAFTLLQWDQANRLATSLSALGAVGAIGVAIWAALRQPNTKIRVSNTGKATSGAEGKALTGLTGPAGISADVVIESTGDADASQGGEATSGGHLSDSRNVLE